MNHLAIESTSVRDTTQYILTCMISSTSLSMLLSKCQLLSQRLCPFGYLCEDLSEASVRCSDKCNNHTCEYGSCYIDHEDESMLKCRCPADDDGYVYSGARCEHKSLSKLIIITSAVGGAVLIAAFFIICLICIKFRRHTEEVDDIPLVNLPDYSKYFPRDSMYQPQYGYDLPLGRGKDSESRSWEGKSRYIPASGDGQENMTYVFDDQDVPIGGNDSELARERQTYDYIGMDTK
ncbi:hypothetical protein ACJMK2_014496, partial [Sinanodonta woodiana]